MNGPASSVSPIPFARDNDASPIPTASFIGIIVAISGNVVISLALNTQKLAHKRIQAEKDSGKNSYQPRPQRPVARAAVAPIDLPLKHYQASNQTSSANNLAIESTPINSRAFRFSRYGTAALSKMRFSSRNVSGRSHVPIHEDVEATAASQPSSAGVHHVDPVDLQNERNSLLDRSDIQEEDEIGFEDGDYTSTSSHVSENEETAYLRSRLWWLGFTLMNIGEFGNFLSYAYAPASVVAPLGAFALIANCLFAPLMLKERFRVGDLLGLCLCIIGVVTIVLGSKSSDIRLDPDALIRAVSRRIFVIYSGICISLAAILAFLSSRPVGQKHVWVDLGLCALFGGFTVLSTKGISTLISLEWIQIYRFWITYPILMVLVATGVGQIKYLNRALMKFDSKVVIPTQFVLFNFTAIVGSAVLYRDFDSISYERMIIFLYGCAATFLGVFILARPNAPEGELAEHAVTHESPSGTTAAQSQQPGYPFPSSTSSVVGGAASVTPGQACASPSTPIRALSGSLLRARASSTGLRLSPAQYLLLATGSSPTNMGLVASPIRQQSLPQGAVSTHVSRRASRSRSGERGMNRRPSFGGT